MASGYLAVSGYAQNPFITHMYTADPSARDFNDTLQAVEYFKKALELDNSPITRVKLDQLPGVKE
jgi:hypothetical protein